MVTRAVSEGRGIAGLMAYLMHDKVVAPGDRYPTTAERVAWAEPVGGSPTADVDLCVRIMQGVSADAAILKQLSGASTRGRKLRKPYAHFMTSWPPGETPSREEMLEVGSAQLQALGCADRLAIALAHSDTDHAHFHLVVCKVHPETGMAASLNHSGLQLSRFAEQWEREHGGIVIENRVRRNEARDAFAAHVDRYMEENYKPDPNASLRDQAAHHDEILKQARAEARELHPLPPMERKRSRDTYGQPVETTQEERRVWSNLYDAQRAEQLPEPVQRAQRAEVSRLLQQGPAPRVVPEPAVSVPVAPSQPFPVPMRAGRVVPEPAVSVPVAPSQPCPSPVPGMAVQVLADLCAQARRVEEPLPAVTTREPVYPDPDDDVKPLLAGLAEKLVKDHPRAPWLEIEQEIGERHAKEQRLGLGALDEQAERRQGCEKVVADWLWEYDHAQGGVPDPVPQEYGTFEKWVHALADLIQLLVRTLFTKQRDDRLDSGQEDTPADDRPDSGRDGGAPGRPVGGQPVGGGATRPAAETMRRLRRPGVNVSEEDIANMVVAELLPDGGEEQGVDRPARQSLPSAPVRNPTRNR